MIPGTDFDVRQFLDLVRRRCGVLYVSADSGAVCADETPQLLILEMRNIGSPCDFGADIVVVGSGAEDISHLPHGCIKSGATVIFDPQDVCHCRFVADPALRPVTCGAGERNTVSISSIGDESLVLSVGRDVKNVYGKLVEVQDYVFHGAIWDISSAVLACTLLLLTEKRGTV